MNTNIWICPAHSKNLEKTIVNKYNGEYVWALNEKRKKSFDEMNIGDICLFGLLAKDEGLQYMGFVKDIIILDTTEDEWPFRSPSGTYWKYAFTFDCIYKINISPSKARELRGFNSNQHWQMQVKLKEGKANFMNYLHCNHPDYFQT